MKLTLNNLSEIFSLARDYWVNDKIEGLDAQQFVVACYVKAIQNVLELPEIELPKRKMVESDEE